MVKKKPSRFNAESTTDQVLADIDLTGKTAVITGATGGLGAETARALASKGATVVLAARDQAKLATTVARIKQSTGNQNIFSIHLDLADLKSVRIAADQILTEHPKIHMLINNAGVMACPLSYTAQGMETQFGVNHVGHFLFTNLLISALLLAAPSRVVNLSSGGHKYGCIDLHDPNWEDQEYNKWKAYGAAKTANALFAVELNNRLSARGVTAFAVHPGVIYTDLARHLTEEDIQMLSGLNKSDFPSDQDLQSKQIQGQRGKLIIKSVEAGAATTVWAATSSDLNDQGGLYLEDCQVALQVQPPTQSHGYYDYVVDPELAEELWQKTEELIGEEFDL